MFYVLINLSKQILVMHTFFFFVTTLIRRHYMKNRVLRVHTESVSIFIKKKKKK